MRNKKTNIATYFKFLEIENIRCFGEKQKLDLTNDKGELAQWTLILGDNGVGKTTLLQCLVWMRPVLKFDKGSTSFDPLAPLSKGILGSALPEEENDILESLRKIDGNSEIIMKAEVFQEADLLFDKVLKSKKITTKINVTFNGQGLLEDYDETETNIEKKLEKGFLEPFIVAYGANRQMGYQNVTNSELEDPLAMRLSDITELYDAEERLTKLHYAATDKRFRRNKRANNKNGKTKERESTEERLLRTFRQAIADVLPDELKNTDIIEIEAPKLVDGQLKESRVKLRVGDIAVPLSNLSLGYKTTLAWVLDLSWRLFNHYPKSLNPLEEPAIVIIDEIDLHLHPLWQWRIMRMLANIFKRTQFIATAHSPLMVQSMPNANFAIVHKVDNDIIKIENTPEKVKGWRVDQILNSEYFDVPFSRDPDTEKLFDERADLLLKLKRNTLEEKRLQEIEQQILELPTRRISEEKEAEDLLKQATQLLKKDATKEK